MRRKPRRILAGFLIAVGGLMFWLAPEASKLGLLLLLLAVAIEIIGIYLEHKERAITLFTSEKITKGSAPMGIHRPRSGFLLR